MDSGSIEIITGPMQSGKCHGLGTKILIADGKTKEVEKIVIGDRVMGANSYPCVVSSTTKGRGEMFLVGQSKANSYTVNRDHILSLKNTKGEIVNVSVDSYMMLSEKFKSNYFGYTNVVNYPNNYGVSDDEAYLAGYFGSDPLEDKYVYCSLTVRASLFIGIVEKLGSIGTSNSTGQPIISIYIFSEDNFEESKLINLIKSLGLVVKKVITRHTEYDDEYALLIYGNELPFFQWRSWKGLIKSTQFDLYSRLSAISITPIGINDFYGFTIEGSNHLYMLEDFTVTHNTTELLRRALCDASVKRDVLFINHALDTRSSGPFSTHNLLYKDKISHPHITTMSTPTLPTLEEVKKYHTMCVDEAQFFPDLGNVVDYAEKLNKRVIVSGLIGDSNRGNFGNILTLMTKADKFDLLHASCIKCAEEMTEGTVNAYFTHRTSESKDQISVGGSDQYIPVCRKHYISLNENKNQ